MAAANIVIVGGGAAGFFAAITAAETRPEAGVTLYEATRHPLAKVRISGGGRCNVTHGCFEPRELVRRYPRGARELLGPFTRFGPRETIAWYAARGVELKTEADGRMFPVTDDSATIVECLQREAARAGVRVVTGVGLRDLRTRPGGGFAVELSEGNGVEADALVLATGGNRQSVVWDVVRALGHTIEPPVPSLFTFHVADARLAGLAGLAVAEVELSVPGTKLRERGPVLVTHAGLSGPGVLRLSAWGARELAARDHRFELRLNWCGGRTAEEVRAELTALRAAQPRRRAAGAGLAVIPGRLWERLAEAAGCPPEAVWAGVSNAVLQRWVGELTAGAYAVTGKSSHKEEFVTCGGVRLREVDFSRMESRRVPGLHFAGEMLDLDGITGGFNFQAAWTTGWLAGRAAATPAAAG
jgi:predicted Rossmann fold flavoprotein